MYKAKRYLTLSILMLFSLALPGGCRHSPTPRLVNELTYAPGSVNDLQIAYDEEHITFFASPSGELIIREYMTIDKRSYYAKVTTRGQTVAIREGSRPLVGGQGFSCYVEVYLPSTYAGALSISTSNGNINLSALALNVQTLRFESSSGHIICADVNSGEIEIATTRGRIEGNCLQASLVRLTTTSGEIGLRSVLAGEGSFSLSATRATCQFGALEARRIELTTTGGEISCARLSGQVAYQTTHGSLMVAAANGSGSYQTANSGRLEVCYEQVGGDLTFFNKNDDVVLTLPADLAFQFEAQSRAGAIRTSFQDALTISDGLASGTVGGTATVRVQIETRAGDILVEQ